MNIFGLFPLGLFISTFLKALLHYKYNFWTKNTTIVFILCVWEFFPESMSTTSMECLWIQKRALNYMGLGLQVLVSSHANAGNRRGFFEDQPVLFFCNSWAIAPAPRLSTTSVLYFFHYPGYSTPLPPAHNISAEQAAWFPLVYPAHFSNAVFTFFSFALYPLIPHLTEGSLVSVVLQCSRLHESMYLFHSPDMEAIQVSFFFSIQIFHLLFDFFPIFWWSLLLNTSSGFLFVKLVDVLYEWNEFSFLIHSTVFALGFLFAWSITTSYLDLGILNVILVP